MKVVWSAAEGMEIGVEWCRHKKQKNDFLLKRSLQLSSPFLCACFLALVHCARLVLYVPAPTETHSPCLRPMNPSDVLVTLTSSMSPATTQSSKKYGRCPR